MKKEEIRFDRRNFRKHSKENKRIIRKSLEECGAGRSVLIDADGELIAGNGVYEQAEKLGIGVKVVETDGTELVVVKRTDLHTEDEKRNRLAFADNASSDNVEWNVPELTANIDAGTLADFGVKLPTVTATEELSKVEFTGMYYEPKNVPNIRLEDCYDTSKFDAKMKVIDESNLPEKTKQALRMFAYRFIRIDFESVANYYAFNASEEEKQVIERLRMVFVDGGINGFVEDDMLRITEFMIESNEE